MIVPKVKPNLVDMVVGYFSPKAGLERVRARAGLTYLSGGAGGYDSGRSEQKALQRYNPRVDSAVTSLHPGLDTIRSRSRDQSRNNPLAAGALNTAVTSTVGGGLTCQPQIDQDALGLTDEQADAWEREASRIWEAWAESTECDLEDELTFGQIQELAFRAVLESGDILRIRRFLWDDARGVPRRGGVFATKLQLVEADRVSNLYYTPDTTRCAAGVEVDDDGRVVAYWVQTSHPGDSFGYQPGDVWTPVVARHPKTGQRLAQLMFHKRRPGQRRGVPYLAPVIGQLKQLERYSHAELMAAVISSFFTVFVTSEEPENSPLSGIKGTEEEPEVAGDLFLGEGLVVDLNPGEDIKIANPGRPNTAFDPFVRAILQQVGVALEMPFEVLIKSFQASYSASRASILDAYKFFRGRRKWLVRSIGQPAYEDVISEAVARGMLEAPGFFEDPLIRRAWLGTVWTGDAMPQIDPLKEASASKMRIDIGVSTIDREARETNGSTFLENHGQRRKEARMRNEAGLDPGAAAAAAAAIAGAATPQLGAGDHGDPEDQPDTDTDDETQARRLLTTGVRS